MKKLSKNSVIVLVCAILLAGFGCVMVYSASKYSATVQYNNPYFYLKKQIIGVVIGLIGLVLCWLINHKIYKKSSEKEKIMIKLCAFADEADNSLQGQIEALKRNGIGYLELRNVNGKNVKDITVDEAKKYAKILKENGIEVYSVGSPIGKVDISVDFEKYLEEITHIFRVANALGTKKVRMFSFFNAYEQKEKVISYLQRMVEKASEYGIELYHENEKDIYGDVAERVEEILNSVSGLKSVYDPANYLQVGDAADKTLDLFHKRTDYFHIKDVVTKTGELVPAGYGDGKIDELIRRIDGDKVLSIEPHLAVFEGYSQIDNTEMKHKFTFHSNNEAFDAAVDGLKKLLKKAGYKQSQGGYIKG